MFLFYYFYFVIIQTYTFKFNPFIDVVVHYYYYYYSVLTHREIEKQATHPHVPPLSKNKISKTTKNKNLRKGMYHKMKCFKVKTFFFFFVKKGKYECMHVGYKSGKCTQYYAGQRLLLLLVRKRYRSRFLFSSILRDLPSLYLLQVVGIRRERMQKKKKKEKEERKKKLDVYRKVFPQVIRDNFPSDTHEHICYSVKFIINIHVRNFPYVGTLFNFKKEKIL